MLFPGLVHIIFFNQDLMKHNTENCTKTPLYSECIISIGAHFIMLFLESKNKIIFYAHLFPKKEVLNKRGANLLNRHYLRKTLIRMN